MFNQHTTIPNQNDSEPSAIGPLLLVEDNRDDAQLIQRLINRQSPQLATEWLWQAEQVIPYLENALQSSCLPSLVLLDLYLPGAQRGLQVLQAIKSHQAYQQIPVVILSRSQDPEDMATALSYSATAYLVKPESPQQWLSELAWVQQYANPTGTPA
jgi:CheY-like chemotaxis protein